MKLDLSRLESAARQHADAARSFERIVLAVTRCMESTRQLANDLRPVALTTCSVCEVIGDHARDFAERSSLRIGVTQTTPVPRLQEAAQLLLFRAAQEALTNVARHARASKVEITIKADDERVTMEVLDDGVGMAPGALHRTRSLGLLALRERFEALGGELTMRRGEGRGTLMIARLPAPRAASAR